MKHDDDAKPRMERQRWPEGGPQVVSVPQVYRSHLSRLYAACARGWFKSAVSTEDEDHG